MDNISIIFRLKIIFKKLKKVFILINLYLLIINKKNNNDCYKINYLLNVIKFIKIKLFCNIIFEKKVKQEGWMQTLAEIPKNIKFNIQIF